MTGWLTYFVNGLSSQMKEVRDRAELVIRRDVIVREERLNERQALAVGALLQFGGTGVELNVGELESFVPGIVRRTLQRDLKGLVDRKVVRTLGAARAVRYRLADKYLRRIATESRRQSRQDRDSDGD